MSSRIEIELKVEKDNSAALKKALAELQATEVLVGVPDTKAGRQSGKINNAALAYIHDNGSPARNIPARPFMDPGVRRATERINSLMQQIGTAALRGEKQKVQRGFEMVGLAAQSSIRSVINEGVPPPLKPGTIAARQRRGRRSVKPLIDTGQLRNSITYVVQRKG